jgi:hypothetical protein
VEIVEHVIAEFLGTLMPGLNIWQPLDPLKWAMGPKSLTANRVPPSAKLAQTCVKMKSPFSGVV